MTLMGERIVGGTLNERTTPTSLMKTHGIQWIDDFVSEHRVKYVLAALWTALGLPLALWNALGLPLALWIALGIPRLLCVLRWVYRLLCGLRCVAHISSTQRTHRRKPVCRHMPQLHTRPCVCWVELMRATLLYRVPMPQCARRVHAVLCVSRVHAVCVVSMPCAASNC